MSLTWTKPQFDPGQGHHSTNFKKLFFLSYFIMKVPKTVNRYCPHCNKKTEQKIKLVGTGFQRGTMTRGSKARARLRGKGRGIGNKGKWGSKPAMSKFKRKSKTTKKTNIMYTCGVCGKSKYRQGRRNKRTGKQVQE